MRHNIHSEPAHISQLNTALKYDLIEDEGTNA